MANKIQTLVANVPIKNPADKVYNFFKYNMHDFVKVYPAVYTGYELLEGEEGHVGCIMKFNYILGVPLTVNVLTEAVDDAAKSLTWTALEGSDILVLYKSFKISPTVTDGSVEWKIEYEGATLITPPPETYLPLVITLATLLDAYLLLN